MVVIWSIYSKLPNDAGPMYVAIWMEHATTRNASTATRRRGAALNAVNQNALPNSMWLVELSIKYVFLSCIIYFTTLRRYYSSINPPRLQVIQILFVLIAANMPRMLEKSQIGTWSILQSEWIPLGACVFVNFYQQSLFFPFIILIFLLCFSTSTKSMFSPLILLSNKAKSPFF